MKTRLIIKHLPTMTTYKSKEENHTQEEYNALKTFFSKDIDYFEMEMDDGKVIILKHSILKDCVFIFEKGGN